MVVSALTFDRRQRGHAKRHHHVDLVRLLFLGDAPATTAFDRDRARDRKADSVVGIDK